MHFSTSLTLIQLSTTLAAVLYQRCIRHHIRLSQSIHQLVLTAIQCLQISTAVLSIPDLMNDCDKEEFLAQNQFVSMHKMIERMKKKWSETVTSGRARRPHLMGDTRFA